MLRRLPLKALLSTACLTAVLIPPFAHASAPSVSIPADADASQPGQSSGPGPFGFTDGIMRSQTLLGTMWGVRPWLSQYGVSFGLLETSEVLGNVTGGQNHGFDYDGLTQMAVQVDTQRAFEWYGGTFNISALNIHGRNLSADNLGTLQTASGIESDRATRLWELWYQQKFLDQDRLDIKIGEQSLDQEFMGSANANYFINTMFGWPMVPSADLPGGGPAYPMAALGVRARWKPNDSVTLLGGIFNGNPTPINSDYSQSANASGAKFPLDGGLLAIAEVQYAYPALGSMVSASEPAPLSRVYKLGIWYDTENFADQEYDNIGLSLANPGSSGVAQSHHGDYGIYAVADQMLWQSQEEGEAEHTLNFFTRLMGTPQTDRNLIDFSMNAGFTLHEPFEHRDDDTFGIGMGWAHVSNRVAALEKDAAFYNPGTFQPIQRSETFVEVTYQYQITPWWQVQPDFQYVFNPGGGVVNPNQPDQRIGNEAVIGIRTNISF